jgi:hypothetical protein
LEGLLFFEGTDLETEMGREYSTYGEKRGAYGVLAGKSERSRPLGRRRRRREDNIKMDLPDFGLEA